MSTLYYPTNYGAAEFVGSGSDAGTANFVSNFQGPSGTYTVITSVDNTSPQEYIITTNYSGPGTGTQFTAFQTPYSDTNHNETYAPTVPIGGGATSPAYLILTNGPVPSDYTYTFSGQSSAFDPTGGTTSDPTICFASGTCIRTLRGDVQVENLRPGDIAVTASGFRRPIVWIGHRTIDCCKHPHPQEAQPIHISAHAFGAGLPERDLFLSPGHPVLVGADEDCAGGHLVPIMCLVNGTTIARDVVASVTYWHVELDEHDILLAEGLPAESYIDLGSRDWFQGANGALCDPDLALREMPGRCRPVAIDGPIVEAERRRLDTVFAGQLSTCCSWPSEGILACF